MQFKSHIRYSLFSILFLFVLNFALNHWSMGLKSRAIEQLQQETMLLGITTDIKQGIGDIQKQIARLGQLPQEGVTPLGAQEKDGFEAQSARVAGDITRLKGMARGALLDKVTALQARYAELAASWHLFNGEFGNGTAQAMTELVLHAEPYSQQLLYQDLPALEDLEKELIENARQQMIASEWWSEQTALLTFLLSMLVALWLAVRLYRRFVDSLRPFAPGVAAMRQGEEAGAALAGKDELGEISAAFYAMGDALHASRQQCEQLNQQLEQCGGELDRQRKESGLLLCNILPATIAEEFRTKGAVQPKYLEDVTILFTDFVGFSSLTEKLAAEDLVHMLHDHFSAFDEICARYGLEKLKTIGDSYMCAGGLPERNPSHPVDAVMAAMEMIQAVAERSNPNLNWSVRIGIHTGHVIAGMVGSQKFAYDIWGESVNYASRVESSGEPNRIALSAQTYGRTKDFFECEKRVKTHAKVAHKMDLYFVKGFTASLVEDTKQMPPDAFVRRYRGYFQKDPPSFPPLRATLAGRR